MPQGLHFPPPLTSYFDNTTRVPFLQLKEAPNIQRFDLKQELSRIEFLDALSSVMPDYLRKHHRESLTHEYCHAFQTVYYPYLFAQSQIEISALAKIANYFTHEKSNMPSGSIVIPKEYNETFMFPNYPVQIVKDTSGYLQTKTDSTAFRSYEQVSITDLAENAASIWEYRFVAGKFHSSEEFSLWLNTNLRYRNVFDILVSVLGEKDAYEYLPALVLNAFNTTMPIGVFGGLVNFLITSDLRGQSVDEVDQILKAMLWNNLKPKAFEPFAPLRSIPKCSIDNDVFHNIVSNSRLSLMHRMASRYLSAVSQDKRVEKLFYHPEDPENVQQMMEIFPPPITVVNFDIPTRFNIDRLVLIDPIYSNDEFDIGSNTVSYGDLFLMYQRQKDFFYNLMFDNEVAGLKMRCRHSGCPLYELKKCRGWPMPIAVEDCIFPEWLLDAYKKRIEPNAKVFSHES